MTVDEARTKYATERGQSAELDEANLKLLEAAILASQVPPQAPETQSQGSQEPPHVEAAPVTPEQPSETKPHE